MLKIQRASAGSGKTYALAKTYILNLISYQTQTGKRQLRNIAQIEDALSHILAITFTNKATNEMKQRIVKNLSLLSKAKENIPQKDLDQIPYLKEFQNLTGADIQDIGLICEHALKTILNHYSNFKISTIDSFFQEILRTFTYEANLNGNYQLEIDSTYVLESAIDAAIHNLDAHPEKMGNAVFWLKLLIRQQAEKTKSWNLFGKKSKSNLIYVQLTHALKQLEGEDFKEIKEILDNFFSDPEKKNSLPLFYKNLREEAIRERRILLKKLKEKAELITQMIVADGMPDDYLSSYFRTHLLRIAELQENDKLKIKYDNLIRKGTVFNKKAGMEGSEIDIEAFELYNMVTKWINPPANSYYKNWLVYNELLPYLGLLLEVRSFLNEVLESNNLIQISDTGYILKRIIGEDDTPFIYERLGNRIDNYLIDEFQDTSKMQWNVLYPLISESEGKGKGNLIIGDPKQSIYRFRNADHTLITEVVPLLFPNHEARGFTPEDNTNWRSHTLIVKFNNFFFKHLSESLSKISHKNGNAYDFTNLYSNVIQTPSNKKGLGYVEVRFFDKSGNEDIIEDFDPSEGFDKDPGWYNLKVFKTVPLLINSLKRRGYHQKDIGILVNRNQEGQDIIKSLIAYNEIQNEASEKINFISEESLLVSNSRGVRLIISLLKKLTDYDFNILNEETSEVDSHNGINKKYVKWNDINIDYTLYASRHQDMTTSQRIMSFLKEKDKEITLKDFIQSLPTPSLSSIVESLIENYMEKDLRKSDALYLSAFQDIINEYCQSHYDDPSSFLEWWYSRGNKISVASPYDVDAVQIMTIHKSKGLEFKCVILPYATKELKPSDLKPEWRWITPEKLEGLDMPPVLPIKTTKVLEGSAYHDLYKDYYDQVLTDNLNMNYVAFTRARNELYIFTKQQTKESVNISFYLSEILKGENQENENISDDSEEFLISYADLDFDHENGIISLGRPFTEQEIANEYLKETKENETTCRVFNDYYINSDRPHLKIKASTINQSNEI